jgi:transposase
MGTIVLGKVHDMINVLATIGLLRIEAVIPTQKYCGQSCLYNRNLYAARNKAECCFHYPKQARACSTRYQKRYYLF